MTELTVTGMMGCSTCAPPAQRSRGGLGNWCAGNALGVVLLILGTSVARADWPQFLGPERNGISGERGLLEAWPADGLKEVWRSEGGVGMSGIAVVDKQLLTMIQTQGRQWVVALDALTGRREWGTPVATAYRNSMGDGPRATPAVDGSRVFAYTGEGILVALNRADGKLLWQQNVVEQLGGKTADYGMACSPLLVGDLVVVTAGAPGGTVAAFDRGTGKRVWASGTDPAGYSSPALLRVAGRDQLVVFTGSSLLGLEPRQGTLLWRYPYVTDYDCNIATPLSREGQVFISSGENHGSVLLSIQADGDQYTVNEVWSSQGTRSTLRNEWQTSIQLGDFLYGLDNVGSAGPVTHLTCIDARNGQRVWQEPRFGKSNLIAADGKLFFSTMKGEVVVARATPDGYHELGRQEVLGTTRQAPALCDGRLYLRDDQEIVCLDVRKP